MLFITHDFGIVRDIADRIAVMENGAIVEIGAAADILQNPAHPHTRALIGAVTRLTAPKSPAAVPATPRNLLEISGLSKTYGNTMALADVSLTLHKGTTLAIVGESGSGKSTLARLILRITGPTAGTIMIDGKDFSDLKGLALRTGRRNVQMIFQDPYGSLNPRRRVGDMIARAAQLAGANAVTARARARDLVAMVGLPPESWARKPAAFSGGQRQRIGIARALAMEPQLLVADESIAALDVLVQQQILDLLAEIQARLGIAILFITHDLRTAGAIADRIAVMHHGRIAETGTPAEILGNPQTACARRLVEAIPGRSPAERALTKPVRKGH